MALGSAESRGTLHDVIAQVIERRLAGESLSDDDVIRAYPELLPGLQRGLQQVRRVENARRAARGGRGDAEFSNDHDGDDDHAQLLIPGYTIEREISHGGQAVVYLAHRTGTDEQVAIKVLRAGALGDERRRARFIREAELLASIDHPGIVKLLDRGTTADGQLYLVMNYIAGEPLNPEYFATRPLGERLQLFLATCRAVDAAHERGIVHRDLKPGNVRLDLNGRPHVLDFGLSIDRSADDLRATMTVTGQFLGSFLWASPEQQRGAPDAITPATDVYALGVVLHQLITGGRFPPQVLDSVHRALQSSPDGSSRHKLAIDCDPRLVAIVSRCLIPDPRERFARAGALADAIEQYLADPSTAPNPRGRFSTLRVLTIAAIMVTLAALIGIGITQRSRYASATKVNGRPILQLDRDVPMLWVPPGEFLMGSPTGEGGRLSDEQQHRVRIPRGFYLLKTEVSQELYSRVTGKNPSHFHDDPRLPVESVTWYEAMEFCRLFSQQTHRTIRLPTEAEWEYACRAGSNTIYSFGDDPRLTPRYANFADRSNPRIPNANMELDDGSPYTAQVGAAYLANSWGFVQMHGNVWEWCETTYEPYPNSPDSVVTIDHIPATQRAAPFSAVARGGSFYDTLGSLRCANRCAIPADTREFTVGFRVVCEEETRDGR